MRAFKNLLATGMLAALLGAVAGPAAAATAFDFHDGIYILSMTPDGRVLAGPSMNGVFEAVRWTSETGAVPLGMSSGQLLGQGGGYTKMSDDGNRICSSTVNADTTLCTPGLWTKGVGWQALIPPLPVNGAPDGIDGHLGSPYDISGDGSTVVGLCWLNTGRGRAFRWTAATGAVDLGGQGVDTSARANVTNHDGSVVGGWSADPVTYMWQPTIWENGVMTVLNKTVVACQVQCMNSAGTILGGSLYNPANQIREPAVWFKSGGTWTGQRLGVLPDSAPYDTQALCNGITDDGSLLVGEYLYDISFRTGFVWTLNEGLMTAAEFFAARGVAVPANIDIGALTCITGDGNRIAGYCYDYNLPGPPRRSFVVTLDTTSDAPRPAATGVLVLGQPTPNPFNPSTSLAVTLAADGPVRLAVYDLRGALVRVLGDGPLAAGDHVFSWDGRDERGVAAPSGVYLARAETPGEVPQVRRLTLTK